MTTVLETAITLEPQPATEADRGKLHRLPRPSFRGPLLPPLIGVEVDFDREQSDWIRAEAHRTGLTYTALVKRLVDAARTGHSWPSEVAGDLVEPPSRLAG